MRRLRLTILPLISCLTFIVAAPALAHTSIEASDPEVGEQLAEAPERVRLVMEEPVEAEFSPLEVYDEDGQRVDRDNASIDPEDPAIVTVGLQEDLPPGSYTVEYRYTGIDGHVIDGSYQFGIARASTGETPEQTSVDAEPASADREESGGFSSFALYAVLGVAVLALLAVAVLRGRRG